LRIFTFVDADHTDAVFNGTDKPAEIAAHAFMLVNFGHTFGRSGVGDGRSCGSSNDGLGADGGSVFGFGGASDVDALMSTVPAGGVTELATDASIGIDASDDFEVEIEVLPIGDTRKREATEVFDGLITFGIHPVAEAIDHVFHNTKAVVHGSGASLEGTGSEENEFGGVAPAADAADGGDGELDLRIASDLLNHVESDGFDSRATVATVRGFTADIRAWGEGIEINAGDGIDGVDGGESVGTAFFSGARDGANVTNVGS